MPDAAARRTAYTVADLAGRFGVTVHTVLAWIAGGELRAVNAARKPGGRRALVERLLEDGGDLVGPMDAAAAPASDPDEALRQGFRATVLAVVDDDGLSAAEKVQRIKELLTAHEKLAAGGRSDVEEDDDRKDRGRVGPMSSRSGRVESLDLAGEQALLRGGDPKLHCRG
jgi:hypothetical protein